MHTIAAEVVSVYGCITTHHATHGAMHALHHACTHRAMHAPRHATHRAMPARTLQALKKKEDALWEKTRQKRVNSWRNWSSSGGGSKSKMPKVSECVSA